MATMKRALSRKFKLGKHIKCRSGWIWQLADQPDKLIKITQDQTDFWLIRNLNTIAKYLNDVDSPAVVKIHDYGSVVLDSSAPYHYHVMDKLEPLPKTKDTFWVEDILTEYYYHRRNVPWFCSEQIRCFLSQLKKLKYKYHDLHSQNVMLDRNGKLKLIDIESFLPQGE
jgi:serine/threonine protein kinase